MIIINVIKSIFQSIFQLARGYMRMHKKIWKFRNFIHFDTWMSWWSCFAFLWVFTFIPTDAMDPIGEAFGDVYISDVLFSQMGKNEEVRLEHGVDGAQSKQVKQSKHVALVNIGRVPRRDIATIINVVNQCDPKAVGLDIFFRKSKKHLSVADSIGDIELEKALANTKNLVMAAEGNDTAKSKSDNRYSYQTSRTSIPEFVKNATLGYAHMNIPDDETTQEKLYVIRKFWTKIFIEDKKKDFDAFPVVLANFMDSNKVKKIKERNKREEYIGYVGNIYFHPLRIPERVREKIEKEEGWIGDWSKLQSNWTERHIANKAHFTTIDHGTILQDSNYIKILHNRDLINNNILPSKGLYYSMLDNAAQRLGYPSMVIDSIYKINKDLNSLNKEMISVNTAFFKLSSIENKNDSIIKAMGELGQTRMSIMPKLTLMDSLLTSFKGLIQIKDEDYAQIDFACTKLFEIDDAVVDIQSKNKELLTGIADKIRDLLKGKIVLLGYIGDDLGEETGEDKFYTPLNNKYIGKANRDMYGVVIHANIISTILREDYIDVMPEWMSYALGIIITYIVFASYRPVYNDYKNWYDGLTKAMGIILSFMILFVIGITFEYWNYEIKFGGVFFGVILLAGDYLEIYYGLFKGIYYKVRDNLKKPAIDDKV